MIKAKDELVTPTRPSFIPQVLEGGLALDIDRLTRTMAMLEDYVDIMMAMDEPLPGSPRVEEDELRLRVASL
jgi:hypothetical protein